MYLYHITYFHFISHAVITTNRAFNISNSQMFFLPLDFWESQSVSLDSSGKSLSSENIHRLTPNFQLQLGGYLSPPSRVPPIAGLQYLLEHHMLVLFESTHSYINQLEFDFIIVLPRFEPLTLRSSNYQAELTLYWIFCICLFVTK